MDGVLVTHRCGARARVPPTAHRSAVERTRPLFFFASWANPPRGLHRGRRPCTPPCALRSLGVSCALRPASLTLRLPPPRVPRPAVFTLRPGSAPYVLRPASCVLSRVPRACACPRPIPRSARPGFQMRPSPRPAPRRAVTRRHRGALRVPPVPPTPTPNPAPVLLPLRRPRPPSCARACGRGASSTPDRFTMSKQVGPIFIEDRPCEGNSADPKRVCVRRARYARAPPNVDTPRTSQA